MFIPFLFKKCLLPVKALHDVEQEECSEESVYLLQVAVVSRAHWLLVIACNKAYELFSYEIS